MLGRNDLLSISRNFMVSNLLKRPIAIGSDRALDTAIITAPDARDPELMKKLDAVAGRVLDC